MIPELHTIGYEATTLDCVIRALRELKTEVVIDVRAIAASRKQGFSKRQLAAALDEAGIAYLHLQGLGTPKPGRDAVRAGHPERMVTIFEEHMTSDRAQAELAQAAEVARNKRACLLCFERDHMTCHRRLVAEMIAIGTGQGIHHLAAPVPAC